jgi:hypothetical protein
MTAAKIFRIRQFGSACLSVVSRPRGGEWLKDDLVAIKSAGIHLLVSMLTFGEHVDMNLTAEAECCNAVGIAYLSVPIPDFGVPSDVVPFESAVAQVVQTLLQDQSVAIHCRQSIGRSGLLTSAVLLAMGMSLEEAVATASEARGLRVPESPEQRTWLTTNAQRFANVTTRARDNAGQTG